MFELLLQAPANINAAANVKYPRADFIMKIILQASGGKRLHARRQAQLCGL